MDEEGGGKEIKEKIIRRGNFGLLVTSTSSFNERN